MTPKSPSAPGTTTIWTSSERTSFSGVTSSKCRSAMALPPSFGDHHDRDARPGRGFQNRRQPDIARFEAARAGLGRAGLAIAHRATREIAGEQRFHVGKVAGDGRDGAPALARIVEDPDLTFRVVDGEGERAV